MAFMVSPLVPIFDEKNLGELNLFPPLYLSDPLEPRIGFDFPDHGDIKPLMVSTMIQGWAERALN